MVHEHQIRVRYAETGIGGRLKPVCIFNYFQDIASDHCAALGVSALDLLPHGLAWVVYQYTIDIGTYPAWKQLLTLRTWRHPFKNLYELRCFEVIDESGQCLITGKSSWVLTRTDTKKPVRLNRNLPETLFDSAGPAIENDFAPLPLPAAPDFTRTFTARMHDLDFNRHVNNSVFMVWAMEAVPAGIAQQFRPQKLAVLFFGEACYGEQITAATRQLESNPTQGFIHHLSNKSGKEITRVMTSWQPIEDAD
ncbi:MAG: acyl-[acyl-carrier-protein] thioesterase [Thermodesulfobacteriota bacterium]